MGQFRPSVIRVEFIPMGVLNRYIVRSICAAVLLVLAVLVTLLALFLLIDEQGFVGTGSYGQAAALWFVLKSLPGHIVQFLPMAALIGALLATGAMARQSELTVMRAAGISIQRIAGSIFLAGILLVPVAVLLGEFIAPQLTQTARMQKAMQRSGNISFVGHAAAWIRDGNLLLRADSAVLAGQAGGITLFRLSNENRVLQVARARSAKELANGRWELADFRDSTMDQQGVVASARSSAQLAAGFSPAFLGVIAGDPADLSLRELRAASAILADSGQDNRRYRFEMWAKIAQWVAIPLAVLLALPLLFGTLRSTETGARTSLGVLFGLGYFILQKMVANGVVAFDLAPFWLAWLPTLLLGVAAAWQFLRLRSARIRG
jgi:lipopolysaccharide export system permease protein